MYKKSAFIRRIGNLRNIIRQCARRDWREEGLACCENAKPEFLSNIIPQDHPDRIGIFQFLTDEETRDAYWQV